MSYFELIWKRNEDPDKPSGTRYTEKYQGCVLFDGEHNWHDDSDGFCLVWDAEKGTVLELSTWTTRGAGPFSYCEVDATPETLAAVTEWRIKCLTEVLLACSKHEAAVPARGKMVKVVSGYKVPVGTVGEVFWAGMKNYDPYGRKAFEELRIGIVAAGVKYFTAAKNCKVIDPEQYYITPEKAKAQAEVEIRR